ncbi:hypothetical protein MEQU1_003632 [Malassezia equina]|uniref:Tubulin-specific chaperone A n=1 Tax=Malassezia equina TaxID=1381935 RepID=A0AAF0EI11_9BASI|nr:hypothetical protein MEQU1_003632 [Malassezia equina]
MLAIRCCSLASAEVEVQPHSMISWGVDPLSKELELYGKEAEDQSSKVDKLVAEGADEYDIKKQKQGLSEATQESSMYKEASDALQKAKLALP